VGPTLAGFLNFLRTTVAIPTTALPDNSPFIQTAYDFAVMIVDPTLASVPSPATSPNYYAQALYNLGADALVNVCPDQAGPPPQTFFSDLRTKLHINEFVSGVISSSADESTSQSMVVQKAAELFTMLDLQTLKTPWGRQYMALAQQGGYLVGIS